MPLWRDPRILSLGPNVARAHGRLAAALGRTLLGLGGWHLEGEIPDLPKMVMAVAPHTSNWDFLAGILVKMALRLGGRFVAKHTLFRGPLGPLMRWMGGVAVDRGAAAGFVEATVRAFRDSERMILVVAPEGTRKRASRWKSGFYRIALEAGVPIVLARFDYPRRAICFGPLFRPSGDYQADLARIRSHFSPTMALRPENYG